jgi:hypothetical protein
VLEDKRKLREEEDRIVDEEERGEEHLRLEEEKAKEALVRENQQRRRESKKRMQEGGEELQEEIDMLVGEVEETDAALKEMRAANAGAKAALLEERELLQQTQENILAMADELKALFEVLYDSTFSRTVWRLYGGAKGLVMWCLSLFEGKAMPTDIGILTSEVAIRREMEAASKNTEDVSTGFQTHSRWEEQVKEEQAAADSIISQVVGKNVSSGHVDAQRDYSPDRGECVADDEWTE